MVRAIPWLVLACGAFSPSGVVACTDLRDPISSPVEGVIYRFNDGQSVSVGVTRPEVLQDGSLKLPRVTPAIQSLPEGRFDQWGGQAVLLESDGRGGRRICRVEEWESRTFDPVARTRFGGVARKRTGDDQKPGVIRYEGASKNATNPVVRKLLPHYFVSSVRAFRYDDDNNIIEVRNHESPERNALRTRHPLPIRKDQLLTCFVYEKGRLVTASGVDSPEVSVTPGFSCGDLAVGNSQYDSYRYNADGSVLAKLTQYGANAVPDTHAEGASHDARGGEGLVWVGKGRRNLVTIYFKPLKGLTELVASDPGVLPSDVTDVFESGYSSSSGQLEYWFPHEPVPLSVIDEQLATLDHYARVRIYPHRSGMRVWEVFDRKSRVPRQRQWRGLDLARQETYGDDGKLRRVIHFGPVVESAYSEDLRRYAEEGVLKVTPTVRGHASYRVYDYDAAGKERLALVCWQHDATSNKPLRHFPWWTPDPAPKRSKEEALLYERKNVSNRCGTPDGKMLVEGMSPIKNYMAATYGYDTEKLSTDEVR